MRQICLLRGKKRHTKKRSNSLRVLHSSCTSQHPPCRKSSGRLRNKTSQFTLARSWCCSWRNEQVGHTSQVLDVHMCICLENWSTKTMSGLWSGSGLMHMLTSSRSCENQKARVVILFLKPTPSSTLKHIWASADYYWSKTSEPTWTAWLGFCKVTSKEPQDFWINVLQTDEIRLEMFGHFWIRSSWKEKSISSNSALPTCNHLESTNVHTFMWKKLVNLE